MSPTKPPPKRRLTMKVPIPPELLVDENDFEDEVDNYQNKPPRKVADRDDSDEVDDEGDDDEDYTEDDEGETEEEKKQRELKESRAAADKAITEANSFVSRNQAKLRPADTNGGIFPAISDLLRFKAGDDTEEITVGTEALNSKVETAKQHLKEDEEKDQNKEEKKDEQDEPGEEREEDPTKKANEDPRTGRPEGEGASGEGAAAGEGAEGVGTAAGETAAAAAETTAAAAETAAAATEAAAAAPAAAAAGTAAVATSEVWVPILAIIGILIIIIVIAYMAFGYGSSRWNRDYKPGRVTGSGATDPADPSDPNLREQIAELAVAAGDGTLRQQLTKEKLSDVFSKLNAAATAAIGHPTQTLLTTHITAAKSAASILVEATETRGDDYTRQLTQFEYHMNAIAAALMGIGDDTGTTLAARAEATFTEPVAWVRTANERDTSAPLRDGTLVKVPPVTGRDTRGCDPAGFITYILHNPTITPTNRIAPNLVDLPKIYQPALKSIDLSSGYTSSLLQKGDIILTKLTTTTADVKKTDYGAFIYLGDPTQTDESQQQLAYCGVNGPAKLPRTALTTDKNRTVTALLRLKTAP